MNNTKTVERITGAVSLISLGILLLLNTTGIVPWGVWGTIILLFIKLWPLWLIFAGLQIIFARSQTSKMAFSLLSSVISLSIFITAILAYMNIVTIPIDLKSWNFVWTSEATIEKTQEVKLEDFTEVKNLNLDYKITAGDVTIHTESQSSNYLQLASQYAKNQGEPILDATKNGDTLDIRFTQKTSGLIFVMPKLKYDFQLAETTLPTDMNITMTAGSLSAMTKAMNLRELGITMTAGSADVEIGESVTSASIKVTAGLILMKVPASYRLNVTVSSTAGDCSLNGSSLKNGDTVVNENGSKTLSLTLRQTAGSIEIETY